ncbi:IS110 family transposase [Dehalococcoidia bacterium]|nr:IS110 family transposase [Dehalococcoidia bacterium]
MININAAGIDIGSGEHWVTVPLDRDAYPTRNFGCFTTNIEAMADWLEECHIDTVAMESTGVYWIPTFQILAARGFLVTLVNARQVKNVPGRKTDVLDCQWLQRLHTYGLLSASFRPDDATCVLRSYWRHRENLIRYASGHIQHMQKALTEMNIQLHKVISDITGVTGMDIIRAILAGERNPMKLAQMKDHRIKSSTETIAKALQGDYRQEHLFALKQALQLYDVYQQQIQECHREIEAYVSQFESKVDLDSNPLPSNKKPRRKSYKNEPSFDLRTHLYRITGVDFTLIDGLDVITLQTIFSEVGFNPGAFPTSKNFTSWLALCPNNRITGGRVKSSNTRKVANRAAKAFRLAAQGLANSKSALGAFYRRTRARLGAPEAITATAHKLARIFYHLWTTGESYQDPGVDYYEQKHKERTLNNIRKKAELLGYEITLKPIANTG